MNFSNIKSFLFENKTLHQTIFKNTFWLMLAEGFGKIVAFLVMIMLARHFGPTTYGEFAFALSFVSIFAIFSDFGISTLVMREVARDKEKTRQYMDNAFLLKIIMAVIVSLVIAISIHFVKNNQEIIAIVYFLSACMIIDSFSTFFQSIFMANEKMQYTTICRILVDIILLGLMLLFIFNNASIVKINYAYLISSLVGLFVSFFILWRYFSKFFLKIDINVCKDIIKKTWPFGLSSFFFVVYYYLASVWLGITRSSEEVGLYNVAFRTSFFAISFSGIIFTSFLPLISRFFKESLQKLNDICTKYATVMFIVGMPIGFGGMVIAGDIIDFFYKESYKGAILPFQILAWGVALSFLQCTYCNCLLACDKQKEVLKVVVWGFLFNIIVNFILIPKYGVVGAASGILLTEFFMFIIARNIFDGITKIRFFKIIYPSFVASTIMWLAIFIFKQMGFSSVILLLLLGIVVYCIAIYFLYLRRNKEILKEIFLHS